MLKLKFNLRHQDIQLVNKGAVVATDSKDYLVAKFNTVSDDWETPLTAVFTDDKHKQPYAVIVGADERLAEDECFVPWEVLTDAANVYVSVYCGNLHTTVTASFKVRKSGYIEGETPPPPSPTVYDTIIQEITDLQADKQNNLSATGFIDLDNDVLSLVDKFFLVQREQLPKQSVQLLNGSVSGYTVISPEDVSDYRVEIHDGQIPVATAGTFIRVYNNSTSLMQYYLTVEGELYAQYVEKEGRYWRLTFWAKVQSSYTLSEQDKQDIANIVISQLQGGE